MLIGDDLWRLFACDSGPGVAWSAAGVVVVLLPLLTLFLCVLAECVFGSREG